MADRIFLDTVTVISGRWDDSHTQREIAEQLGDAERVTSTYVLNQYKAAMLNAAAVAHNLLQSSPGPWEAVRRARKYAEQREAGARSPSQRVQDRIVLVLARFAEQYENERAHILDSLESYIEGLWEEEFYVDVKIDANATECCRADGVPRRMPSGAYEPIDTSCNKSDPRECAITQFWQDRKDRLTSLAAIKVQKFRSDEADRKQLEKVRDGAIAIGQGGPAHGARCANNMSDAVILIEGSEVDGVIGVHSTNQRDFKPLGEVLGIPTLP